MPHRTKRPLRGHALVFAAALAAPAALADHSLPTFGVVNAPTASTAVSGGDGASWSVVTSLVSGNPHTDLDIFRVGEDFYVAAGTLAAGGNGGGQVIHRLTAHGELNPAFVSFHPSASCVSDPGGATGLQHDVEVTPKGRVLFNTDWHGKADTRDAQLLLDATDADGRCHDQLPGGTAPPNGTQPKGGLEIVDITDLQFPVEIGLTSHIGEAHTVNVDPKRSHIAFAVSSDTVTVSTRTDENNPDGAEQGDLDGFELVDLSSCMNFPAGTSIAAKRAACRPKVYRYRFDPDWVRGSYAADVAGACHELELYPDDRLACASLNGTVLFDLSGAYDDNGTPDDYTDDIPRGTPLPCDVRASKSNAEGLFATGAMVTDCVNGANGQSLEIGPWIEIGAPSLEGVKMLGFVNHNGRTLSNSAVDSRTPDVDIAVSHEAELTQSGRFLLATDERGGGIIPPDAACPTPTTNAGNNSGNGGVHAYVVDKLHKSYPEGATGEAVASEADSAYALTPSGEKAIFRATPRVAAGTFCTAHVMHIVPGQNRIFMGWYSQGTQVVDFIEHEDGTFEFIEKAWWVPEGATTWASAVFAYNENEDGSYTYWGATSDITRTAVDVYEVTLPPPPRPLGVTVSNNVDAGFGGRDSTTGGVGLRGSAGAAGLALVLLAGLGALRRRRRR